MSDWEGKRIKEIGLGVLYSNDDIYSYRHMQSIQNQELLKKYKNGGSFGKEMKTISVRFKGYEQIALYSKPSQAAKQVIISIGSNEDVKWRCSKAERIDMQVVLGMKQQLGKNSIEFLLRTIVYFVPRPSKPYSIIYINTLADLDAYSDFKKLLEFLPIEYFYYLDRIFVFQASFKEKAFDLISFDYLTKYIKSKTVHISSFQELLEYTRINGESLLKFCPNILVSELTKGENVVNEPMERPKQKFGVNLQKKIEEYEIGQTGAPIIIEMLIYYFNGKEECLSLQGIFRKSANVEDQFLLLKDLQRQNFNCLEAVNDPHLVANAIKRFLSNLAEPIIPFKDFNVLMEVNVSELKNCVVKVVESLSLCRKMTLLLVIDFCRDKLLAKSAQNLMNEQNLSIVLGPCLMRSEVVSMKDLAYAQRIISITIIIFKDFQIFFGSKKERNRLIRQSIRAQQNQTLKERLGSLQILQEPYHQHEIKHINNLQSPKRHKHKEQPQKLIGQSSMQPKQLTPEEQFELDCADDFLQAFKKKS